MHINAQHEEKINIYAVIIVTSLAVVPQPHHAPAL